MMLEMQNISKHFGAVKALEEVDFGLQKGEVHALVGENGAGKSTLMKILAGVQRPTSGKLKLNGEEVSFGSVSEAQSFGVAMVYQELALVPHLSVAENLFLGRLSPFVRHSEMRKRAKPLLEEVELDVNPAASVNSLSVGEQQLIEIAKAVAREGRILILDEPTAALSSGETRRLFSIVRKLKEGGASLIYISHRLEEIFEIADRVTVLRDGEWVATHRTDEVEPDEVVREMVGRDVKRYSRGSSAEEEVLATFTFEAEGLERGEIEVKRGEIVGLAGVVGSGRGRVLGMLFGEEGEATLNGDAVGSPKEAIDDGLFFVPGDRKSQGIVTQRSVQENLTLAILQRIQRVGFLKRGQEREEAKRWIERLGLRPPDPSKLVSELSGGNQQKVVVGKALATEPRLLLLEEPTRGVDVGARSEIYDVIDELAKEGLGLVVSSSDTEELIGLCDRILVFREGKVAHELHTPMTYEEVVSYVTGAR